MKKLLLMLTLATSVVLASCSGGEEATQAEDGSFVFERPIELVVPFGAGGGSDTTWRAAVPYLEEQLGTSIKVNNVSGASGVKGAEYFNAQPDDGYTFLALTPSHTAAGARGTVNFDIMNDIKPVAKIVQDANVIVAGADVPYNNVEELKEYVLANPGDAKIGMLSVDGIDAAATMQLFDAVGIEVPMVPFDGGAEANAAVLGGHVDMIIAGPAEVAEYVNGGDFKGIVVLSEERATTLPDIECTGELGYEAYMGAWRGLGVKTTAPEGAAEAMEAALKATIENEEFIAWAESMSLTDRPGWENSEDFTTRWFNDYDTMKEIFGL